MRDAANASVEEQLAAFAFCSSLARKRFIVPVDGETIGVDVPGGVQRSSREVKHRK